MQKTHACKLLHGLFIFNIHMNISLYVISFDVYVVKQFL